MDAVRQVVALWRLDEIRWRDFTIKAFHLQDLPKTNVYATQEISSALQETYWTLKSTPELVEAAIHMLAKAAEYKVCYRGSWNPKARDGMRSICACFGTGEREDALGCVVKGIWRRWMGS